MLSGFSWADSPVFHHLVFPPTSSTSSHRLLQTRKFLTVGLESEILSMPANRRPKDRTCRGIHQDQKRGFKDIFSAIEVRLDISRACDALGLSADQRAYLTVLF